MKRSQSPNSKLLTPALWGAAALTWLSSLSNAQSDATFKYATGMGDSLALVATLCRSTPQELKQLNPQLKELEDEAELPPGVLVVPAPADLEAEPFSLLALRKTILAGPRDTLRTTVESLRAQKIYVGTVALKRENAVLLGNIRETEPFGRVRLLRLPLADKGCMMVTAGPDDTIDTIVENCQAGGFVMVSAEGIRQANRLTGPVKEGQVLVVPLRAVATEKDSKQLEDDVKGREAYFIRPSNVYRLPFPDANGLRVNAGRSFIIMMTISTDPKKDPAGGWVALATSSGTMWAPRHSIKITDKRGDVRSLIVQLAQADEDGSTSRINAPDVSAEPLTGGGGASPLDERIIGFAQQQLGKPYIWGSTGPNGFDCSGLVLTSARRNGIALPRTAREQVNVGVGGRVGLRDLQRGDRVYFDAGSRPGIDHTAIYLGNNRIIEANGGSAKRIKYSLMSGPKTHYDEWFVCGRRGYRGRTAHLDDEALGRLLLAENSQISPSLAPTSTVNAGFGSVMPPNELLLHLASFFRLPGTI